MITISRTKQTELNYQKRCDQLILRYAKEVETSVAAVQPINFVNWLIALKSNIKKTTFRQYKSAVIYGLAASSICKNNMDKALLNLEGEPQTGCLQQSTKTSSPKAKCYPPEVFDRVVQELRKMKPPAKFAKPLLSFLLASIALGLRPGEWGRAELGVDDKTGEKIVTVKNSKTTNGRGSGPERVISYDHMPEQIQGVIKYIVDFASTCEDWGDEQKKIADLHYRIQKRISPKGKRRYTLYSCRHQCSANMKLVYDKDTIAEVMGHGSIETATTHYGRRTAGRKKISKHINREIVDMLPSPIKSGDDPSPSYTPNSPGSPNSLQP